MRVLEEMLGDAQPGYLPQVEEIARAKTKDLTGADLEAAIRTVAGTARSMGVEVVD